MKNCVPLAMCVGLGLLACEPYVEAGIAPQAPQEASALTAAELKSLVVTEAQTLSRFSFTRTIEALRSTAVAPGQQLAPSETSTAIYQRWMRSFDDGADGCLRREIDRPGYGLDCPRAEAALATIDPFDASGAQFVPVGVFNRFDLAPADGSHCGEYRIVYAMPSNGEVPGRAFMIFEASLPNPTPSAGIEGCRPVAAFWDGLRADTAKARAAKLEAFFYTGTALPGFGPVVSAKNYGLVTDSTAARAGRPGQIRTDFFVGFAEWQLREFKLQTVCPTSTTCALNFNHVPVRENPANELFDRTHARAAEFEPVMAAQVPTLAATDLNGIAMAIPNRFNEFESVSQRSDVVYDNTATAPMRTAIDQALAANGSPLSNSEILARATTQTCAGCHALSAGADLGGELTWPSSLGFVHIDEQSGLSQALRNVFLPHRRDVLTNFLTGTTVTSDPALTIAGRPVGAAN